MTVVGPVVSLQEGRGTTALCIPLLCEDRVKRAEEGPHWGAEVAGMLTLNFPSYTTIKNKFLLLADHTEVFCYDSSC